MSDIWEVFKSHELVVILKTPAHDILVCTTRNRLQSWKLYFCHVGISKWAVILPVLASIIIYAEKLRRFDWFRASLFPRNSGITAIIIII